MSQPIILCLESATDVCSVAITQGHDVICELSLDEGQQHSSQLTILIDQCLENAGLQRHQLSAISISDGPGSYTGLRVGASVAKGIGYALNIPLIAIPTLKALAEPHRATRNTIISTIDARRMEAYMGIYENGQELKPVTNIIWDQDNIDQLSQSYDSILICGNGIAKAKEHFSFPNNITIQPSLCNARLLGRLSHDRFIAQDFVDIAYHTPFYYKSPNITKPKKAF